MLSRFEIRINESTVSQRADNALRMLDIESNRASFKTLDSVKNDETFIRVSLRNLNC